MEKNNNAITTIRCKDSFVFFSGDPYLEGDLLIRIIVLKEMTGFHMFLWILYVESRILYEQW